jgi:glycosyltransferase involved in cell wall biosynthesis
VKVLHLIKVQGVGGAEQHLLQLLPALRERDIDARLLSLDAGRDAERFHRALDERGVPWRRVATGFDVSPRLAGSVIRAVRDERPDLLHTHMVHGDVYGSIAASALRVPFVSSRHNDDRYLLGPFRYVDRAFMVRTKRLIAISDSVRRFLATAGLPESKLITIHYGLDELPSAASELTPEQAGVALDAALVLAIGRLIEQKDHATLLRAFARVRVQHPHARLAILGWGTLEEDTRMLADELGLADAVLLPGRVEPRAWLERADVFAHTSRWEGFGIVLLEAMLAGLPVVATRVSAIPEIVADGQTGLLVEAGHAEAMAAGLTELLDDPQRRRTFGQAGLARAHSEFSVARMAQRTSDVYRDALV